MVLPYELIRELIKLMIWPAVVKDERDRRPRLLSNHSWDWGWPLLNETTKPHAPPEAMQLLVCVLMRASDATSACSRRLIGISL